MRFLENWYPIHTRIQFLASASSSTSRPPRAGGEAGDAGGDGGGDRGGDEGSDTGGGEGGGEAAPLAGEPIPGSMSVSAGMLSLQKW